MDKLINEVINNKLAEMDLPRLEELNDNTQEYLAKLEYVLQRFDNERDDLLRQYKLRRISIVNTSREASISRATIYNYKNILEKYIQYSQEIQGQDDIYCKSDTLIARIKELENELYLLQKKDVNLELLKYENSQLINNIREDAKTIKALEKQNKMLIGKIELLEKRISRDAKKR